MENLRRTGSPLALISPMMPSLVRLCGRLSFFDIFVQYEVMLDSLFTSWHLWELSSDFGILLRGDLLWESFKSKCKAINQSVNGYGLSQGSTCHQSYLKLDLSQFHFYQQFLATFTFAQLWQWFDYKSWQCFYPRSGFMFVDVLTVLPVRSPDKNWLNKFWWWG